MAQLVESYACAPSTERGRGILISGDPKSNSILYCNGRSVIIRCLDRPLEVAVYAEHSYPVTVAWYSPNGEWVASADVSGTVRIWGTHNDFVLKNEFKVLSGSVDDLQWSPDSMRIVAAGDGKGKSFVRAFITVGDFDGHSRRVLSCAFKPTRPFRIATCGEDFLVNFYEGPPFKFKLSLRGHTKFVNCTRFSPDGSKLVSVSSDMTGIIYDGKTGEKIGELSSEDGHTGSIYAVSWSPDSKEILTVSADKSAKMWEIPGDGSSGKVKKTLSCPGSGGVDDMLVGCLWQNDHLIIVSLGGMIHLFSASDLNKSPLSFYGHMKNVTALTAFKNQKSILSCSYDGVIVRWIQGTGFDVKLRNKEIAPVKCFAAVEEEIVLSGFDNKVWRVPIQGKACGTAENVDINSQAKDISFALNCPGLTLVSTGTGVVFLQGLKIVSSQNLGFAVTACTITPDGSEVVVGGEDGKLHIYSHLDGTLKEEAVLEKHRGPISGIHYSPDLSMIASSDLNREAVVWDRVSKEVKLQNMLFHTARINCLAWSPDNTMVATGSLDTCVIIYEIGKPASSRITIKGAHLGGVYGLAFTDECTVVSSGEDAFIRLWRLQRQ